MRILPRHGLLVTAILLALSVLPINEANALRKQPRPDWMVAIGWGMGRAEFRGPGGTFDEYREGGVALLRVGRMFGQHAMVNINYAGWIIELGDVPLKNRRSLQNLSVGLSWFPGNQRGASCGIYVRAGAGTGWIGAAEVPIIEGEPQGHGERVDEWGWGAFAEGGYEIWISHNSTLGVGVCYTYINTGEDIVDRAWYAGATLNFNIYF
jgi:hypothetical protein